MSSPQQQTYPPAGQPPPPPAANQLVRDIAIILVTGYALHLMAEGIEALLKPLKIGKVAIMAALGLVSRGTAPTPRAPMAPYGLHPDDDGAAVPRAAAAADLYFRAAYVLNASTRIEHEVSAGTPLPQALAQEKPYYALHENARRNRLSVAARVGVMMERHGELLGWYRDPFSNSEAECIEADGNNFYANEGTVIGYPGAVHPHCSCYPGPPHWDAGMVNDVLRGLALRSRSGGVYQLKKAG